MCTQTLRMGAHVSQGSRMRDHMFMFSQNEDFQFIFSKQFLGLFSSLIECGVSESLNIVIIKFSDTIFTPIKTVRPLGEYFEVTF